MEQELEKTRKRMKELRIQKGYSYQDLANLTGFSKSVLQRYETGETDKLPLSRLKIIAKALQCSPAYLMGWDDTPPTSQNPHIEKYYQLNNDNKQTVNNLIDDLSEKQERLDALIQQLKEEQSSQTLIAASTGKNKVHQEVTDPEKLKHIEELSEKARKSPGAKITD